jgi:hypothetical protein
MSLPILMNLFPQNRSEKWRGKGFEADFISARIHAQYLELRKSPGVMFHSMYIRQTQTDLAQSKNPASGEDVTGAGPRIDPLPSQPGYSLLSNGDDQW